MTSSKMCRVFFLATLFAVGSHATPSQELCAQEDAYTERATPAPSSGFFGRFFSPSHPKRGMSRPPREPMSTGGLFVPLKSFSNPFRSRNESLGIQPERPRQEPFQDPEVETDDLEVTEDAASDSEESDDESGSSSRKVAASGDPVPPSTATPTPKSNATRMSLSGAALNAPTPRSNDIANTTTTPQAKPNSVPKHYEASPKSESIDAKGTSRRSTSGSVGTTLAKAPKTYSPENQPESKSDTKTQAKTNRPSEPRSNLTPLPLTNSSPPASSVASVPKSSALPPPPSSKSSPMPNMTLKSESKSSAPEEKKVTAAILATRSTVIGTPEPAANRTNVPKPVIDGNKGLDLQSPAIRLRMAGPDTILVGQNVPYEVIATNEGEAIVQGLVIRLSVPNNVQVGDISAADGEFETTSDAEGLGVAWALDRLPSGSSKTLRLMIRTEHAEHFALSLDWTLTHPTAQLPVRVQQPQLQLALEGPAEVDFGSPQIYRLRVRNPGNAEAQGVMVELSAEPYGSNQSEIGDIPAGSERIVEVELTFQQAGRLPIHAKAVSTTSKLESLSSIEVDVRQSLLVASWSGPTEFYQGNVADYVLTLENQGRIPAINNACRIKLPLGAEIVQIPKGATRSGDQLRWDVDRIAPGEKQEYALQVLMNKLGENPIDCQVESSTGEPAHATHKTVVDAIADLQLSVNDPIAPAPVGQSVTYEITVTNRGKKSAEDVYVIAQFSDGIEPIRVDGHTGKLIPGQAIFDAIPSIGPNEHVVLRIVAEASKPGTHRFRAAVRCQGTEDDLLKEESTRFTASGITRSERK